MSATNMVLIIENNNTNTNKKKKVKLQRIEQLLKNQNSKSTSIAQKEFNNVFEKTSSFTFPGKNTANINKITVISYMEAQGKSYDIRLYDVINNKIICTQNFDNTKNQINTFDNLENLPNDETIVEVHCRFNSNNNGKNNNTGYVYIDELSIIYDLV